MWSTNRTQGRAQLATVKCTFARVFIPKADGGIQLLFSFQKRLFPGDVLEDCNIEELDQASTEAVFGQPAMCSEANFADKRKPHVGKLTNAALAYVQANHSGQPSMPYVMYFPQDWIWEDNGDFKGTGLIKRSKRKLLAMLLAGASLFM